MPYSDPQKRLENQRRYVAATKERRTAQRRAWAARNVEKLRAKGREYYHARKAAAPAEVREANKLKARKYRASRKGKFKDQWRRYNRKSLYGISHDDFVALLAAQKDACAGCGTALTEETAHVDHCHATKKVRGLLCRKCNLALGHANDDPLILRRLATYLEIHT